MQLQVELERADIHCHTVEVPRTEEVDSQEYRTLYIKD